MKTWTIACAALLATAAADTPARHEEGVTPSGAKWAVDLPANWNGTVLLYSRGFSNAPGNPPRNKPKGGAEVLLARGYALLGSGFSAGGWALEEAVPDQIATLDAFVAKFGKPQRVIAYGDSMGGLITAALVERHPDRIDGGLPMCASVSGVLGMENQALDGAWALRTLVDSAAPLKIVGVWQPGAPQPPIREEGSAVDALIAKAKASPAGRARLALAAAFAQLPDDPDDKVPANPSPDDLVDAYARWFAQGVFFPRWDQERRAGGNASWNTGVDYAAQLAASGKRATVEALYAKAGLSLADDLATLARAPRIAADPKAVAYMRANFVPGGRLKRPVLSIHTTGDGATMVTYQDAYARTVRSAGAAPMLAQAYVRAPGHCTFTAAETIAAVDAIDRRIATGKWDVSPAALNRLAAGLGESRYVAYRPATFLRPCGNVPGSCPGEPRPVTTTATRSGGVSRR